MGGVYSFGARMRDGLHGRWQEGLGFGLILPGRVKATQKFLARDVVKHMGVTDYPFFNLLGHTAGVIR
jgi:hypothetical protein